jgi:[NiFe] hydrogenase large subunit
MSDVAIKTDVSNLQIQEGGQASFQVRLASQPKESVTVSVKRESGDSSLSVVSGASLSFSRKNYGQWQTVTLRASEDANATNGQATFVLKGEDLRSAQVTVTTLDNDASVGGVPIQASETNLQIPEGERATFNVRLTARPTSPVTVRVARIAGDSDITVVSGGSLSFTTSNYNTWKTVTLAAAEDSDATNGQATFSLTGQGLASSLVTVTEIDKGANPANFRIVTDKTQLAVPEGGKGAFQVKLSADPGKGRTVAVTVGRNSGDADINVSSGSTYYFNSSNWSTYYPIELTAAVDADGTNGQAVFAISASGVPTVCVTATEQEASSGAGSRRVVIDPVSRIEGHLRIEVEVSAGKVARAWSSATLFRGIEPILSGRNPHDAPLITQRLCGVCTYVHQLCSVRAIEDAVNATITDNARIVRNLTLGAQFLHDHVVHFYQLHGLDWADVTSALAANATATAGLARQVSPSADLIDFAAVKARLQKLVATGNLGPFANACWGHPAYKLSPEENLILVAHYLKALEKQVVASRMMAILGGKNPHPQSTVVGGVTCGGELTAARLDHFRSCLDEILRFVDTAYIPDLMLVAKKYPAWKSVGMYHNFMACGEFPLGPDLPGDLFIPRGMILNGDYLHVQPLDESLITEHVAHSWYSGTASRHPASGQTMPAYTSLDTADRYSWSKAPRYGADAMEVGPLARVLVGYGLGKTEFVAAVEEFLGLSGLREADLLSTLGRTAARAIETVVIGDGMYGWLNELQGNLISGNRQIFRSYSMSSGTGAGFTEAPRGALGHWINIQDNAIAAYQMVVPSTWNFSPRCAGNIPGPLEQALVGIPVADPSNPLEVLRVVHSFDPCIACAVHVIDTEADQVYSVKVV